MSKKQQLFLLSFLCFLFYCSSYGSQEERDKNFLRQNLTEQNLRTFIAKYPYYVNKFRPAHEQQTVLFHNDISLAFFLIQKSQLPLAIIMAEHGDRFDDKVNSSTYEKNIGSTPLIVLAFIQSKDRKALEERSILMRSILQNNPYAFLDQRADGMTPFLIAIIRKDVDSINLLEETCSSYHPSWLQELYDQRTIENNNAIDLLKYSIDQTEEPETQKILFSKFMAISERKLRKSNITDEEFFQQRAKFIDSVRYLKLKSENNHHLHELLQKSDHFRTALCQRNRM